MVILTRYSSTNKSLYIYPKNLVTLKEPRFPQFITIVYHTQIGWMNLIRG